MNEIEWDELREAHDMADRETNELLSLYRRDAKELLFRTWMRGYRAAVNHLGKTMPDRELTSVLEGEE